MRQKTDLATATRPATRGRGGVASSLGALNAAHASERALANAAPNSRVGRIATYRDTVQAVQETEQALQDAQDLLDGMAPPARGSDEVMPELDALNDTIATDEARLADLQADLAAAGGSDPDIEAEILDTVATLQGSYEQQSGLQDELAAAQGYEAAEAAVETLAADLETLSEQQVADLEAAANKPVTPEVEAEVQRLLGLTAN